MDKQGRQGPGCRSRVVQNQGIVFDAVNEPLPEQIARWNNDTRKIYADFYIDDKAVTVETMEAMMDQVVDIVDKYKMQ